MTLENTQGVFFFFLVGCVCVSRNDIRFHTVLLPLNQQNSEHPLTSCLIGGFALKIRKLPSLN